MREKKAKKKKERKEKKVRDKHKMVVEFLYKEAMSAKKQQKEKLTNNNK